MISDNIQDLQELVNRVVDVSRSYNLKVNSSKTKFMIVSRRRIEYGGAVIKIDFNWIFQPIEKVYNFKYLGAWLSTEWDSDQEIRCRIEIARNNFHKFRQLFTNRQLNFHLRLRLVKGYI